MVFKMNSIDFDKARELITEVLKEISKVYVGKKSLVELSVATLFSGGHLLIEGYPGTGKTLLAKLLAKAIGGRYKRIQGHPDILPSDILGFHVYRIEGDKLFVPGPIFTNILLVDEVNRIPTRSQAALLEAMQESQVTIDGETYQLKKPFLLMATQVPFKISAGTYHVVETLLDRFMSSALSEYNPFDEEVEILSRADTAHELPIEQVTTPEEVYMTINSIPGLVHVERNIKEYIVSIISYLRSSEIVEYGPSHRASIDLLRLSRVLALMDNRDYVIPDDVKNIVIPVVSHRIKIRQEYEAEGYDTKTLVKEVVNKVAVPK